MSKDYHGDSPKGSRYGENPTFQLYEGVEEDQFGREWESTNRKMLFEMIKELETEHLLTTKAIAQVLHVEENYVQMIIEQIRKTRGDE